MTFRSPRILRNSVWTISAFTFFSFYTAFGQTNPAPQPLPYSQHFGSVSFTTLPPGMAAWNGMNGAAILTQAAAEMAQPAGDATIKSASAVQTTGGMYGYAATGNALVYVQGSNNAVNGVNELALAVTTRGATSIKINYSITMLFGSSRSAGIVLQWRAGAGGPWTSVPNSVYEANSSTRATGEVTAYTDLVLPTEAENKDTVQVRWAFWHGTETGTVTGIGIDDITIFGGVGTAAPPPPTLVSLADQANDQPLSVTVSWKPSSSATNYRLQLATTPEFSPVLLDSSNITGLTFLLSNLAVNTEYYWRVSASNGIGSSDFSPSRSFTTQWTIAPAAPTLLSPGDRSMGYYGRPVCMWTTIPGALTYRLQLGTDSSFGSTVIDAGGIASATYQTNGLAGATAYWWRVQASNNAGTSAFSPVRSFTTAAAYRVPQRLLFTGIAGAALGDSLAAAYTAATVLDYQSAREKLYGEIDKVGDTLKCVYSGYACYMPPGVPALTAAANGLINAEHSFPQSVGAGTGNANSDMHHIYGTKDNVNSARGNLPYAEIPDTSVLTWYRLGESRSTKPPANANEYSKLGAASFEPRDAHKGHVARAILYFYTMYHAQSVASFFEGMKPTLLKWHLQFPVDSSEYARTLKIAVYQSGKANPFILDTTLVQRVYGTSVTTVPLSARTLPSEYRLEQNYPNPFNPSTSIRFTMPVAGMVSLRMFDVLGRVVATLVNEEKAPGAYAVTWSAAGLPSGMYFYRLESGHTSLTRKLVLAK